MPAAAGGYTLAGYSKAADATFFYVPELKIQLDLGGSSKKYYAESFFLTHSHLDHSIYANVVQPAGFVSLSAESRHTLFAPIEIINHVKNYMLAGQELNDVRTIDPLAWFAKDSVKFDIMPVKNGDSVNVNKKSNLHVKVIDCTHGVPTVGFLFFELRKKLKQEYQGVPGKEIARLRKEGIEVQEDAEVPLFAFMGDTTEKVFADHPELFQYPLIITECSFLFDDHQQQARDSFHTHWRGVEPYVAANPNTSFMFIHFSLRYKDEEIEEFFANQRKTYPNVFAFV
eukprot:TRINITY_DN14858_c0_g1_i1.p1 TRINITY_DN14858_c0_g1~~TRINITY_DN14858_c0_g1_i1.p1  ORF type:complete len:285 (-),score=81.71 TRINITY_DN14858_c0_g1_i1:28-882(-)